MGIRNKRKEKKKGLPTLAGYPAMATWIRKRKAKKGDRRLGEL